MKRGGPRRNWNDARAKVDQEGMCRVCGESKRRPRRCKVSGKVKFSNEGRAREHARLTAAKWSHAVYVYRCSHCGKWHRTSREPV